MTVIMNGKYELDELLYNVYGRENMPFPPFPLYVQVVYLRIRARNDMKILALMEFSEYTLKVLLPRNVLSAEKRFSDVSLDLYISHASDALIFSEDTR